MSSFTKILGSVFLFFNLSGVAQAAPFTIDFTSGSGNNSTFYQEDGFSFVPESGDHFEVNFQNNGWFNWHDGSANTSPNIITMSLADGSGGAFSVYGLEITSLFANAGGIVFSDSNGNSVLGDSLGALALNFSNTTFLQFQILNSGTNSFPIAFDNLAVDTNPFAISNVPEPESILLFGLGLIGVWFSRKKKSV